MLTCDICGAPRWSGPGGQIVERRGRSSLICVMCAERWEEQRAAERRLSLDTPAELEAAALLTQEELDDISRQSRLTREELSRAHAAHSRWLALKRLEERRRRERKAELDAMPYADYLRTPEWERRRRVHVRAVGGRCQLCNAADRVLHIHHRTYERRGWELFTDLIVLCEDCHDLFHREGRLADPA